MFMILKETSVYDDAGHAPKNVTWVETTHRVRAFGTGARLLYAVLTAPQEPSPRLHDANTISVQSVVA